MVYSSSVCDHSFMRDGVHESTADTRKRRAKLEQTYNMLEEVGEDKMPSGSKRLPFRPETR